MISMTEAEAETDLGEGRVHGTCALCHVEAETYVEIELEPEVGAMAFA